MQPLSDLLRRGATAFGAAGRLGRADRSGRDAAGASPGDRERLLQEIQSVAHYVSRLKGEIRALRPNEIYRDRLPSAHGDLNSIKEATASSANVIMAAAEAILASKQGTLESYRAEVEDKVLEIFEACSFQDITGQRVARVDELLGHIEKRLQRFALAVNASDSAGGYDREAIMREARREVLIVEGPQDSGAAVDQGAIDKLFD